MNSRREVIEKALGALLLRLMGAGLTYAMTILVVRTAGAGEAGYFFLGLSLVAVLTTVGNVGLELSVLRFIGAEAASNRWTNVRAIVSTALHRAAKVLVCLAIGASTSLLVLDALSIVETRTASVLAAMTISSVALGLTLLYAYALQGCGRTSVAVLLFSVLTPALVIIGVCLLPNKSSGAFAVIYTLATIATLGCAAFAFQVLVPADSTPLTIDTAEVLVTGRVFWAGIVANQLLTGNGHLIAGMFLASHDITVFAVAQRTVMLVSFVLVAVNVVVAPRYSALHASGDRESLQRMSLFAAALSTVSSLPLVVVLYAFPAHIMNFFEPGLGGAPVLVLLTTGHLLNAMCGTFGLLLGMTGHEHFHRRVVVGTTLLAVVLLFVLTPSLGVSGSALAIMAGLATQNAIQSIKARSLYFNGRIT